MLSGQVGKYKYYEIEDMYKSAGCHECHSRTLWYNNIFPEKPKDQYDLCIRCPVFMAVMLTKEYAKQLNEYEWRYTDDGK